MYRMFYTLSSKFLPKGSNNDLFYLFVVGSALYVGLHWWLNMEQRDGIVDKVRGYLYYLMAVDLSVAYVLYKLQKPIQEEDESDDKVATTPTKVATKDSEKVDKKEEFMQMLKQARELQLARKESAKAAEKKVEKKEKDDKDSESQKSDKSLEKKECDEKCEIFTKQPIKVKGKEVEADTDIPVYKSNDGDKKEL